jgi:hypothetical protein
MAGASLKQARQAFERAKAEREQAVAEGRMSVEDADRANAHDEVALHAMTLTKRLDAAVRPDARAGTDNVVPIRPKVVDEYWIDESARISEAWNDRARTSRLKTPELIEQFLFYVRNGVPVKNSREGKGAAELCGISAATVWHWVHTDPEFAKEYRDARDASSEILEDEIRAMLPTAIAQPEMVRSLEFVSARLEWLARTRNRSRYGEQKTAGNGQSITFQIGMIGAPQVAGRVTVEGERIDDNVIIPAQPDSMQGRVSQHIAEGLTPTMARSAARKELAGLSGNGIAVGGSDRERVLSSRARNAQGNQAHNAAPKRTRKAKGAAGSGDSESDN